MADVQPLLVLAVRRLFLMGRVLLWLAKGRELWLLVRKCLLQEFVLALCRLVLKLRLLLLDLWEVGNRVAIVALHQLLKGLYNVRLSLVHRALSVAGWSRALTTMKGAIGNKYENNA